MCVPNRHLSAFGAALLIPIPVPLQCLSWRLFNPNLGAVNLDPNAFNASNPNISHHLTIQRVISKFQRLYSISSTSALSRNHARHPRYGRVTSDLIKLLQNGLRHRESAHATSNPIRPLESGQVTQIKPRHWKEAETGAFEQTLRLSGTNAA